MPVISLESIARQMYAAWCAAMGRPDQWLEMPETSREAWRSTARRAAELLAAAH